MRKLGCLVATAALFAFSSAPASAAMVPGSTCQSDFNTAVDRSFARFKNTSGSAQFVSCAINKSTAETCTDSIGVWYSSSVAFNCTPMISVGGSFTWGVTKPLPAGGSFMSWTSAELPSDACHAISSVVLYCTLPNNATLFNVFSSYR